jgi:hypothetical protein
MRRRVAAVLTTALVLMGIGCRSSAATCTTLNIPNPLLSNYTAPAGTYCPGAQSVIKGVGIVADLTQATINGAGTGYLFKSFAGSSATIKTGTVTNMAGIDLGAVGSGLRASVVIDGGTWTNVVSGVLYKTNDGGRLDGTLKNVTATGMGAGIRTYGSVTLVDNHLTGGGNPSSGDPAAGHALDLNTTGTPVRDQIVRVTGNFITGFTTTTSQGDDVVLEETVWKGTISDNDMSNVSDALVDSKARLVNVTNNTFHGAVGVRMVDSHVGHLYSIGNDYTVPNGAYGLQSTSGYGTDPTHPDKAGLISDGDTFDISSGGLVARATVACNGSTGFTDNRVGVIWLRQAEWTPSGGTPWVSPHSVCANNGVDYFPSVQVD